MTHTIHIDHRFAIGEEVFVLLVLKRCEHLGLHCTACWCGRCNPGESMGPNPEPQFVEFGPVPIESIGGYVFWSIPAPESPRVYDVEYYFPRDAVAAIIGEFPGKENGWANQDIWNSWLFGLPEVALCETQEEVEELKRRLGPRALRQTMGHSNLGGTYRKLLSEVPTE